MGVPLYEGWVLPSTRLLNSGSRKELLDSVQAYASR